MGKCTRCYGSGGYNEGYPFYDWINCSECAGTGLSPEERRQRYAAISVDIAFEKRDQ